jgi:hypothetical protein
MSFYHDRFLLDELISIKKKFDYKIFIETGTEKGKTIETVLEYFDMIYSCEIDEKYYKIYEIYDHNPKVKIYKGNSPEKLNEIFKTLQNDNFFIFLDAHWGGYWPLIDELKTIKKFNFRPVIIIHDFFTGKEGLLGDIYLVNGKKIKLDWDYIKEQIVSIYGENNYKFHYNQQSKISRGCIFIYPS